MCHIYGHCEQFLGCYNELSVLISSVLEAGYTCVHHDSLMVCQHIRFAVQKFLAVLIGAGPFQDGAHLFIILSVIIGTGTLAAANGIQVRLWDTLELRIGRLFWGHTHIISIRGDPTTHLLNGS